MFWDIQDGHHSIIFMQCGQIRYKVDARTQAEKRAFSHYMIPRFTEFRVAETTLIIRLSAQKSVRMKCEII